MASQYFAWLGPHTAKARCMCMAIARSSRRSGRQASGTQIEMLRGLYASSELHNCELPAAALLQVLDSGQLQLLCARAPCTAHLHISLFTMAPN